MISHPLIAIPYKGEFVLVQPMQIVYVEACRNNSIIYLANKPAGLIVTSNFNSIVQLLPADKFCQISRSNIVSLERIIKMNKKKTRVFYAEDKTLTIGPSFLQKLLDKIKFI